MTQPKSRQSGDLLTAKEAASLLRVTTKTLERWEGIGALIPIRLPSGHRRFLQSDIDALIARKSDGAA